MAERPLSPHLQVYRWQITMALSIVHRVTGVALTVGTLLLLWWLISAAAGPEAYAVAQGFVGGWFGRLVLFGWTVALFFHLCNGIRHLFWDAGWGFEIPQVYASGGVVIVVAAVLSIGTWVAGYAMLGAG